MANIMKLVMQGDKAQFDIKTILFHFEFTSMCNQNCSYCLEGNFYLDKPKMNCSKREDLLGVLDKIFIAYPEHIKLGFILVGGEPTVQPYFKDVVAKIKSRKNAWQILTTNLSQSTEYYKNLDIPLVTSLHLESHEPKEWLDKTLELKNLIAHTRIMAHPQKIDKVKEAYNLFLRTSKTIPLSFAVEKIMDFSISVGDKIIDYKANYSLQDLKFINNCEPVDAPHVESLYSKTGILNNLFYRSQWFYEDKSGKQTIKINFLQDNKFKKFYCECSMVIIRSDGQMEYGWGCRSSRKNILLEKKFPKHEVKTVTCTKKECPLNFASTIPKYKAIKYAPKWKNKNELMFSRINYFFRIDYLFTMYIKFEKKIKKYCTPYGFSRFKQKYFW